MEKLFKDIWNMTGAPLIGAVCGLLFLFTVVYMAGHLL